MSNLYINNPNARVNIYQPQMWDNIYISAKEIVIDAALDVSRSVDGGDGGSGGNSISTNSTPNPTPGGEWGNTGLPGQGSRGGSGGVGGSGYIANTLNNANTLGTPGVSGTDALTTLAPASGFSAFTPRIDYLDTLIPIVNAGSGGGGGGGGGAGNSLLDTCIQSLAAGGGGGGGAGGKGGGKIILLATGNISFGANAALISAGGIVGEDGDPGNYLWTESTDDDGIVTTRVIQGESQSGQLSAAGGDGGDGSSTATQASSGGEGGYGAINFRQSDVGKPGACAYTKTLSEAKKGGLGGSGGAGSGGSIFIQQGIAAASPPTASVNGGTTANRGVSGNTYQDTDITLTILPSGRSIYPYFDTLTGFVSTNDTAWEAGTLSATWVTESGQAILTQSNEQITNTQTALNLSLTSSDTIIFTGVKAPTTIDGIDFQTIYAASTPTVEAFELVDVIGDDTAYSSQPDQLDKLICDSSTFTFSGYDLADSSSENTNVVVSISRASNTEDDVSIESLFIQKNSFQYKTGDSLVHTISGDTINLICETGSQLESQYTDISIPPTFTLVAVEGTNQLIVDGASDAPSATTIREATSAIAYSDLVHTNSTSAYKYPEFYLADLAASDTFTSMVTTDFTLTLETSTTPEFNSYVASVNAAGTAQNIHYYPVGSDLPIDLVASGDITSPPAGNAYFVAGSSRDIPGTAFLDYTTSFYFAVSNTLHSDFTILSADLTTAVALNQTITAAEIISQVPYYEIPYTETLTAAAGTGLSAVMYDFDSSVSMIAGNTFANILTDGITLSADANSGTIVKLSSPGAMSRQSSPTLTPPGPGGDGVVFDSTNANVSAILFESDRVFQIIYKSPITTIEEPLSASLFSYLVDQDTDAIKLVTNPSTDPITGWLYDTDNSNYFYNLSTYEFNDNDKVYVQVEYDSGSVTLDTTVNGTSSLYWTYLTPNARLSQYESVYYLDQVSLISGDMYSVTGTNESTFNLITGSNPSTVIATYPSPSARLDTSSGSLTATIPDILTITPLPTADFKYNVTVTSEITGTYDQYYTPTSNAAFSAVITHPEFMRVSAVDTTFTSVTGEVHNYTTFELQDSTLYSPFSSLAQSIDAAEQYIGYAPLSSVWSTSDTDRLWHSVANVNTWADLTDTTALANLIGPLSGATYNDVREYDASLNALVSGAPFNFTVFNDNDLITIGHAITAIPSGANELYSDVFTSTSQAALNVSDDYIYDLAVTPLTGYYNNDNVALTYTVTSCSGSLPTTIRWDIDIDTFNSSETESLTTVIGSLNTVSSLNLALTSNLQDVGELSISVSSAEIATYERSFGTYYPPVSVTEFSLIISPSAGYLSATPFVITETLNTAQKDITDLNYVIPNIVTQVSGTYDYADGLGLIDDTFPPASAYTHFNKETYFMPDTLVQTISATVLYIDPNTNSPVVATASATTVHAPSSDDYEVLYNSSQSCYVSSGDYAHYLGGVFPLSATVDDDGLPFVVEMTPASSIDTIIEVTDANEIAADAIFDSLLDFTVPTLFSPQLKIYPLLVAVDPALSDAYKTSYLDSGLPIIAYDFETLMFVPSSYRAVESNIAFNTIIGAAATYDSSVDQLTTTSSSMSALLPSNQFGNVSEREVTTTISLINTHDLFVTSGDYIISADLDGTVTTGVSSLTIQFSATQAGTKTVPFTATDGCNTYTSAVVYDFINLDYIVPSMYFENTLPVGYLGCSSTSPLKLVVWDNVVRDSHTSVLYSRGSQSIPFQEKNNRYEHLLPQWRFTDSDGEIIEATTSENDQITSSGEVIGVSGCSEVYYIDDLPSGPDGVLLVATLSSHSFVVDLDTSNAIDLPGFANSKLNSVITYHVNDLPPTHLKVTRDGKRDNRPYYWLHTKIPYTVTIASDFTLCNDCESILFNYPELSSVETPYYIELDDIDSTLYYIDSAFSAFDDDGLPTPGFVRGTIQPEVTGSTVTIYSSAAVALSSMYVHQPFVWVSNPENRTLNRMMYDDSAISQQYSDCINEYTSTSFLSADALIVQVPYISGDIDEVLTPSNTAMWLSGFAGIYGIGVDSCYNVWAADSELDTVYKYNALGQMITSIDMPFGSTPAGVSIDRDNSVYVTLTDSVSVMKYDTAGAYITALVPSNFTGNVSEFENELWTPAQVETDSDSNVWVSYTNTLCSCIINYSGTDYTETARIEFDNEIVPVDMVFDADSNLYVITQFDVRYPELSARHYNGYLNIYDTSATLLSSITGVNNPHYINVDYNNNIWISQGVSVVSVLSGDEFVNYNLSGGVRSAYVPASSFALDQVEAAIDGNDARIGGIGGTSDGKVWCINSTENLIYILDSTTHALIDTFKVYPDENIEIYNNSNDLGTRFYTVSDSWYRSAQAYGDWTGLRYATKYVYSVNSTTLELTGRSAEFDVLESPVDIRMVNDSYNLAGAMSNLFQAPHLRRDVMPTLHEDYLDNAVGTDASAYQSISRQMYEKIANFVQNISDVETCNVDQLYSICNSLDIPIDDYNLSLPSDLRRVMDIVSVHYSILRGTKNKYNLNLGPTTCNTPSKFTPTNDQEWTINRPLSSLSTSYVGASGDGLVVYDLLSKTYDVIYLNETTALSALSGYGLREPFIVNDGFDKYEVYTYNGDTHRSEYVNNLIDWDNERNTLEYSVSSIDEWYGEYGLIEQLIDYNMHKGLGFLED